MTQETQFDTYTVTDLRLGYLSWHIVANFIWLKKQAFFVTQGWKMGLQYKQFADNWPVYVH